MCLIISSEKGEQISLPDLEIAFSNNPDGAGIMYFDGERVRRHQIVTKDFGDVAALARMGVGMPHAIHLRYCTRGVISPDNCHPFSVLSKDEGDEHDVSIMHNGTLTWLTISKEDAEKGISDTGVFATRIQKNLRSNDKLTLELLQNKDIVEKFSKRVSSWNKIVFLDSLGRFVYFNKSSGMERNGMWYSNDYSLKPGYRDKQTAHHGPSTKTNTLPNGGYRSYTYVNGVKVEDTTVEERYKWSAKDTQKGRKVSFTRTKMEPQYVYMCEDNNGTCAYSLVNPDTMCKVRCGTHLGKSERKKLRNWLKNEIELEKLKEERRLERKAATDSKGRRTFSVGTTGETKVETKEEVKEPVTEPVSTADGNYTDPTDDPTFGYPFYGFN